MQSFFVANRKKLNSLLSEGEGIVLYSGRAPKSSADGLYPFKVNKNFYYMTGLKRENFIVTVVKNDGDLKEKLFIESPNELMEKWFGRKLRKEQAEELSGIKDIDYVETFTAWLNKAVYEDQLHSLYFDLEKLSWDEPDGLAHKASKDIKDRYPFMTIKTAHPFLSKERTVKVGFEIEEMSKAVALTKNALDKVMTALRPGVHEYQLASTFLHEVYMQGGDGFSFPTIAASGEDAVILHYEENEKEIAEDTLLLFDCGAQWNEYCADVTRTYPASGKYTDRQKQIYNIVLEAEERCIAAAKPGMTFESMNNLCKEILAKGCMEIGLIEEESEISKYYYHGVSHFLGLDTHDLGKRSTVFEPGMVITVEPGLYIADEGIGIRIEDDILITDEGSENLSYNIPKTIEDIEAFMANRK